ncbi:hypothetical protein LTR70_002006 [Exophiala xenobiotica]|uniref:Uncharacterized protein n=1 Tax=Lithohypha guttulata TaxID=1690604 RepID=A0ABR0KC10_9EURO|nr:hypothetical protein LTR24_005067 [Lithohypha guttulata]KAK5326242.1 hypothetical protein LTR70_002006 [Exophiala xenobiotica]
MVTNDDYFKTGCLTHRDKGCNNARVEKKRGDTDIRDDKPRILSTADDRESKTP